MRKGLHALGPGRRPVCFELNVVDQEDEGQAGSGSLLFLHSIQNHPRLSHLVVYEFISVFIICLP